MKTATKKRTYIIFPVLAVLAVFFMSGCLGSGDNGDTEPPVIVSVTPANHETDVPVNTQIHVVFNKSVINISTATFYIDRLGTFGHVSATVTYNDATHTATLTPSEPLDWNTLYYVTITSDVRSRAGVALEASSWVFTTGVEADTIPPAISERSPNQDYYVPVDGQIYVVFTEPVVNVGGSTFFIKKTSNGELVSSTVSYNAESRKATISVGGGKLAEWTGYTVYVLDTITDAAGNRLPQTQWSFTTDDTTNPEITAKYPEENDNSVPKNATITVTFSESLLSSSIHNTATNFKLIKDTDSSQVDATVIYNDATKTAILYPKSTLDNTTKYRVEISHSIRDLAYNPLISDVSWEFTTSDQEDTDPPTVIGKDPTNGQEDVPNDKVVSVNFSEDVQGVSSSSFVVERVLDSASVSGTVVYNSSSKTATFTPLNTYEEGVWYRVRLTSEIKDTSNNTLSPVSWTFKIGDSTPPVVVSKNPANGLWDVGVNTNITATFSEDVSGVSATSFTVKNLSSGQPISGAVSYTPATKTATFDPDSNLPYDCDIEVRLTGDIKDASNNSLNVTVWTFHTGSAPDTTPPSVDFANVTTPKENEHDVAVSQKIAIKFTEPVTGVGPATVMLKKGDQNGTLVSSNISYDALANVGYITPGNYLEYGSQYTVVVKGGDTTDIKDNSGNKVAADIVWSFYTKADDVRPQVTFFTPAQGTPDVPGNAVEVKVIFSEQVTGVNNSTFKLVKNFGGGGEISCNVSYAYDTGTNTPYATLVPLANIEETGEYKVVLTTGITDISPQHNTLVEKEWTFNITGLDLTQPEVVNQVPANTSENWTSGKVTVIFSEDVKFVSGTSFYITETSDPGGEKIPSVVTYTQGLLTAELEVNEPSKLKKQTTYYAHLTGDIKDRAGNALKNATVSWWFKTPADTVAPIVTSVYPQAGATNIPVEITTITASFTEAIEGGDTSSFYIEDKDHNKASANVVYDAETFTLTLSPTSNLKGEMQYTAHLTTSIKDKYNNFLAGEYTWSFTTVKVADTTPPYIVGGTQSPGNGATGVALDTNITMQFSEHVINAESTIENPIQLLKGSTPVSAKITYSPSNFTVTIDPAENLESETEYTVLVKGEDNYATPIRDASNNALQTTPVWKFTTVKDTTAPTILERSPVTGASSVPLKPTIWVKFSEYVTGVSSSSFYLRQGGTDIPTYSPVYDEVTKSWWITPKNNLTNSTLYTVYLTNAIKDKSGNALANTNWPFTTNSAPYITNIETSINGSTFTSRNDGATVEHTISHIRITFDRAMNTSKTWCELYEGASGTNNPSPASVRLIGWSNGNKSITYNVIGKFKGGTSYQARLYGWGGTFEDPDGNAVRKDTYVGDGIWNFTTNNDTTSPTILSTIPANGKNDVGRNIGKIVIRFSEMMNQSNGSISLSPNPGANSRDGWIEGGRTVVYTIPELAENTTYTVTLTGFQDLAGRNLSGNTFSFKTGTTTGETIVVAEGFNEYTSPNFSNFKNITDDSGVDWTRISSEKSGNGSVISPQELPYMVKAASWLWPVDAYAEITTTGSLSFSTTGSYIMTFKMFHERLYNQLDRVEVYVSTDGVNYSLVSAGALGAIYRYDWSLSNDNPFWFTHYVDLSDYSGTSALYIKLRAYSAGDLGGNVIIDDLKVKRY